MAHVVLKDLVKTYGSFKAVNDVSLTVNDGEFVALVGPSGCGKTTTLNLVAGLIPITSGDIVIGDRVVNDLDPKDRDIAMVFQNYALYPQKTVYKNLAFPLQMRKLPKDEIDRKVREAARVLDMTHLLERKPRELSGGQQQRVALGRALVRDPAVFLMDEPLSNLDAKLRVQMRSEIKQNHQRLKTTTVYVTHDQIEAMTMADRIVVMHDGVIEQIGTPLELYDRPANLFVAGFIGSPAMNMIAGKMDGNSFIAADGTRITLSKAPPNSAGRPVTLGVRPEHFHLDANGVGAEVLTVEPTGSETQVVARFAGQEIMGAFRERITTQPGELLKITPEPGAVHLFDTESGQRIAAA
jgi:multiple sugar transport system ATP-binding protein